MPDFLGEMGGALAASFGAGCASGYGFGKMISGQFKELMTKEIAELKDDRESTRKKLDEAQEHMTRCDETLAQVQVALARLEEREKLRSEIGQPPTS